MIRTLGTQCKPHPSNKTTTLTTFFFIEFIRAKVFITFHTGLSKEVLNSYKKSPGGQEGRWSGKQVRDQVWKMGNRAMQASYKKNNIFYLIHIFIV